MPSYFSTDAAIAYLQSVIVNNKARGMIAEIELKKIRTSITKISFRSLDYLAQNTTVLSVPLCSFCSP
ncbi:hypothetical protein [Chloroflexus sp.]|uniref:hypothetical protein n=1 Tax=Chloroflexus sp. TaxID=1904827 RepID=UPI002ACDD5FF|nr:hypothetical protein [Chloroflexus sp.]